MFIGKLNNMLENASTEETQISNTQNVWDLTKVKIRDFSIDDGKEEEEKKSQSLGIESYLSR